MRRAKPFSIYPDPELRSKVEIIATQLGRSANQQILRFIEKGVARHERRRMAHGRSAQYRRMA